MYTLDFPESQVISQPDQTLEILMSELDPAVMDQFYMKDGVTAKDVTCESGIRDLIPGSVIDATLFNPCGYSMNGMKSDGTYWTIHITPEPEFSYVSFETNLSQTSYDDLIRKVVEVFKPGKFVTTLFVNQVIFFFFSFFLGMLEIKPRGLFIYLSSALHLICLPSPPSPHNLILIDKI